MLDFWDHSEGKNRTAVSQQLLQQCYCWNSREGGSSGIWTTGRNFSLHQIKSVCGHWKNYVQVTLRQLFGHTYARHQPFNESTQMSDQQLANMVQLIYFTGCSQRSTGRIFLHPVFLHLSSVYSTSISMPPCSGVPKLVRTVRNKATQSPGRCRGELLYCKNQPFWSS